VKHSILELKELQYYTWSDSKDERLVDKIYQLAKTSTNDDQFQYGNRHYDLWERVYWLAGMENPKLYFS
jgi:hypothetical protein